MARRKRRIYGVAASPISEPFVMVEKHPQVVTAICLTVLSVIAIAAALHLASAYLMPIAVALVFSVILAPICGRLEWFRLPRAIAALLALIIAGAIAWFAFFLIAQPAARWFADAPTIIDRAEKQIKKLQAPLKPINDISKEVQNMNIGTTPATAPPRTVVMEQPGLTQTLITSVQSVVLQTGFIFLLAYFFLLTREEFRSKIIVFQPKLADRVRTARAFRDIEKRVSGYIVTFSLINVVVGAGTGLACWRLGLPEPLMWGGLAAVFNFVPFLGPVVMMALLGMAGLATFDGLLDALWPVLAFMAISFVEANIVTPTIVGRRMTLNPLAIILAVSFWIWIWGPIGGVIALPLLIMFKAICDHSPPLRVVGALIGAPLERVARIDEAIRNPKKAKAEMVAPPPDETPPLPVRDGVGALAPAVTSVP